MILLSLILFTVKHLSSRVSLNIVVFLLDYCSTSPFTLLEPRSQDIPEFYVVRNVIERIWKPKNCERFSRVPLWPNRQLHEILHTDNDNMNLLHTPWNSTKAAEESVVSTPYVVQRAVGCGLGTILPSQ